MSLNSQSRREQPDLNPDTAEVSEAQTEVVETSENVEPTEVVETQESKETTASSEVDDTAKEPEKVEMTGVVTDCLRLNVREAPSKDAKILAVIPALTEVKVYLDETATDDFCKICTAVGIQGFCMKKYIAIRR